MRKSEKIIILVIVLAIIFSVITVIVIRTVRLFQKFTQSFCNHTKNLIWIFNKTLKHEIIWLIASGWRTKVNSFYTYIMQLTGILEHSSIIVALYLRESFKDVEKPKTDLLKLEEKIRRSKKK